MKIVGHCPRCGAPIYGNKEIYPTGQLQIRYSCECHKTLRYNAESTAIPGTTRVQE